MAESKQSILAPLLIFLWLINAPCSQAAPTTNAPEKKCDLTFYNKTYPLTPPTTDEKGTKYRIAVISDLDGDSVKDKKLVSYLKKGYLTYDKTKKHASLEWDKEEHVELTSAFSVNGRGMELSELNVFNAKFYSEDDKTGIVYQVDIEHNKLYPWLILADGNGKTTKGMKTEWATVKDELLYVGGHGREDTTKDGELIGYDPQWIKTISPTGDIRHINWRENYIQLARAINVTYPGYLKHEAAAWSPVHKRWFFLPRSSSKERYNVTTQDYQGTNVLLSASPDFSDIKVTKVGTCEPTHGFSSVKFIPNTGDTIMVGLKSEETREKTATYILVFTITGEVLFPETKISDHKYEGVEFI